MNYINYYRQMRLILIYDLPMVNSEDRKVYNKFHNDLQANGFHMLQFSVYTKVLQNSTAYTQITSKLNKLIPDKGSIIIFKITEKQFQNMQYLIGVKNKHEIIVGGKELVIFGGGENN